MIIGLMVETAISGRAENYPRSMGSAKLALPI